MKKRKTNPEKEPESVSIPGKQKIDGDVLNKLEKENSINEFIKIKKLQNQILERILEKISQPDLKDKSKKRSTK